MEAAQFWRAIEILIKNYHALNRKIFEVVINKVQEETNGETRVASYTEVEEKLKESATSGRFIIDYKLLTKKSDNVLATGIVDFYKRTYECHFATETYDNFVIRFKNGQLEVDIPNDQTQRWSEFVLKPKLLSWSQSARNERAVQSLNLINVEQYNDVYKELKRKHSERLQGYWKSAKESTDPLKFIYEDLAIAAYLISLWSGTRNEPTAFADLGCGNGLLVHVLNAEGYKGYGFDIRRRKLWSHYPQDTMTLVEQTVEPNNCRLPSDVDWLIGNHSDELSPWIPIMAARQKAKYFLLPCCPFELCGVKFLRRNTGLSAYQDFFQYARHLSEKCGFETLQDRLKIPSTKRLALIGLKREERPDLEHFVQEEVQRYQSVDQPEMKFREKSEPVRNCTQVAKGIVDALVLKIFQMLLDTTTKTSKGDEWDTGQRLAMRDIAKALTKEELRGIKSECGGIKTLLRNKHEVFEFCGDDLIAIRQPVANADLLAAKGHTIRKRLCFFKTNHPQGCPLDDNECSFLH